MDRKELHLARTDANLLAELVTEYVAITAPGVQAQAWKISQMEDDIRLLAGKVAARLGALPSTQAMKVAAE